MVYIYGGGFSSGSGSEYNGTETIKKDVVLFTLNYRLGSLGFMPNKELAAESHDGSNGGLSGLTDQIQALKWIKANAAAFGGDPDSITLYGESAGGLSICTLSVSPQANGLFNRVMLMSGPCNGPWGAQPMDFGLTTAYTALSAANATSLAVLRAAPAEVVLKLPLVQAVDGFVLTDTPRNLYVGSIRTYEVYEHTPRHILYHTPFTRLVTPHTRALDISLSPCSSSHF
jgi:para-nitrobenzyl esterase